MHFIFQYSFDMKIWMYTQKNKLQQFVAFMFQKDSQCNLTF
jgi:hypothetical protein